jgi:hypothetical protein
VRAAKAYSVFVMGETVVDQKADLSHALNVLRRLDAIIT